MFHVNLDSITTSPTYGFGEIDWFGNEQTRGEYGFIKEANGIDHFFMGRRCSGFQPVAGSLVVFELTPSSRHRGKFEAINVCRLSSIEDPSLLLHFALKKEYKLNDKYFQSLAHRYGEIVKQKQWTGQEVLKNFADAGVFPKTLNQDKPLDGIKRHLVFLSAGLPVNLQEECFGLLMAGVTDADVTAEFFSKNLPYGRQILDTILKEWPKLSEAQRLFVMSNARTDPAHFLNRYAQVILPGIVSDKSLNIVAHIMDVLRNLDWRKSSDAVSGLPDMIVSIISSAQAEQRLIAYNEGYFPLDRSMVECFIRRWSELTNDEKTRIINDSANNNIPILDDFTSKVLAPLAVTQPYNAFHLIQDIIQYFPDTAQRIYKQIASAQDIIMLGSILWLHSLIEHECPIAYGECVSRMTKEDQRLFLKKLISAKLANQFDLSIDTLKCWGWTDISTWTLLEILNGLKNGQTVTSQVIISYVIAHIESPEADILIDGYFDECQGRGYFATDGELKRSKVPRFTKWCEGRLLPPKKAKEGEEQDSRQRWWCANQTCFAPCILERGPAEYREFTLWNILKAFDIKFDRPGYERLMGTINRIQQLLEKVRCRECNHIMHPKGQSNYAFYRVNRFCCVNVSCTNHDVVYLSHCINSACSNIVDSRDSARCKPEEHSQEECGWYICSYCLSCCTTEGLQRRKEIMIRTEQEYTCHLEGHRERHEICCPNCGTVMRDITKKNVREWLSKHTNDFRLFPHNCG